MSYEGTDHGWIKRIGGALLAFIVVAVVAGLVRGGISGVTTYANTSPAALESHIRDLAIESPEIAGFYNDLETQFPSRYAEFLGSVSDAARSGASQAEMRSVGFTFMRDFMVEQAGNVARAPDDKLRALLASETAIAELLAKESPIQCAKFTMEGLSASDQPSVSATNLVIKSARVRLAAAVAGKRAPQRIKEPSDQDWASLVESMRAGGVTEGELSHLMNSTYGSLPPAQQCSIGLGLYQALGTLQNGAGLRIYRSIINGN